MQIVDITDPAAPVPIFGARDGEGGFEMLGGARDVEVVAVSGRTYALVASYDDHAVQIMDITDPASPAPISGARDGEGGFEMLGGAIDMELLYLNDRTYVLVAGSLDNAVQIMDITDPASPAPISGVRDGEGGFEMLGGAMDVEVVAVSGRTYALVASYNDHAVQIMDITDPASPVPVSGARDGEVFLALKHAWDVEAVQLLESTYALVSGHIAGIQIIDITNPASPVPTASILYKQSGFSGIGFPADIKILNTPNGTYGVVTDLWSCSIQVIDITSPASPKSISEIRGGENGFGFLGCSLDMEIFHILERTYGVVSSYYHGSLQIIDITDPAYPVPVSGVRDGEGGFEALNGVSDTDVIVIHGNTYAFAVGNTEDAIQIINITDPTSPAPISGVRDGVDGFEMLGGAMDVEVVAVSGRTYALVASNDDHAVQIMDITDPTSPTPISGARDGEDGFEMLGGAMDVEVVAVSGRTYALVASNDDHAVQIMDITDPASPAPISGVRDGVDGFEMLGGAMDVEVVAVSGRTYALVASNDDHAVQIMDITDPTSPAPISGVRDGVDGFEMLGGAIDMELLYLNDRTYVLVAGSLDNAVQIMDITDPASPAPVSGARDGEGGFEMLGWARDVETVAVSGRTYALVASGGDHAVQIMDITDPASPGPVPGVGDGGFIALNDPTHITVLAIDNEVYVLLSSGHDSSLWIMRVTNSV